MLHVHHDVDVVEQHPAVLSFSLATCTMGLVLVHGFVDSIYDRRDLTLVGRRDDNEDIGNGKMLRDIEGNDIEAFLPRAACAATRASSIAYSVALNDPPEWSCRCCRGKDRAC